MKKKRPAGEIPGFVKMIAFVTPCLLAVSFLLLKIYSSEHYLAVIREDGPVEWLQAVFFLGASVFAFICANRFARKGRSVHSALFILFSVGLFFVAMEEISWGQRILRFDIPDSIKKHNVQGEFTIHNLDVIQYHILIPMYIAVGFYGSFAWLALRRLGPGRRESLGWFVPDWFLAPCFLPVFAVYSYLRIGVYAYWHGIAAFPIGGSVVWRDQEPAEFLMALGFLLFTLIVRRRQRREGMR
jgi:hypothetical protein